MAEAVITGQDDKTLAAIGEFGLIAALSSWLPPGRKTLVGIGDDAAVLAAPDGRVVATTDFLLEGRHFRRDWSGARDVGHKAAARSLADVAAMGAEPSALLVALAAPPDLPLGWARELAEGLAAESARAGAAVIGGDTARADQVLLAVTGLGDLAGRAPVRRSGAAPGDLVTVAGPLGHAAAGLALLTAGPPGSVVSGSVVSGSVVSGSVVSGSVLSESALSRRSLIAAHLRPAPPYDAGPEAADLGATAMIDVSDGLLADLGQVAAASGVLIDLASDRLRPGDPLLTAARAALGARRRASSGRTGPALRPDVTGTPASGKAPGDLPAAEKALRDSPAWEEALRWMLTGGEDHSLAATFPAGTRLPPRWRVIGTVRPGSGQPGGRPGHGVVVDGQPWAGTSGWDHFA